MIKSMKMGQKLCPGCNKLLAAPLFSKNKARKDGLQSWCKHCKSQYAKKRYKESEDYRDRRRTNATSRKEALKDIARLEKLKGTCTMCGESDPVVLDHDHIDPSTKSFSISNPPGVTIEEYRTELAKCRLLCANCHRRHTAAQQGWKDYI